MLQIDLDASELAKLLNMSVEELTVEARQAFLQHADLAYAVVAMKQSIIENVYGAYTPEKYKRNGNLAAAASAEREILADGTVVVTLGTDDSLVTVLKPKQPVHEIPGAIERGEYPPGWKQDAAFPRPFVEDAVNFFNNFVMAEVYDQLKRDRS